MFLFGIIQDLVFKFNTKRKREKEIMCLRNKKNIYLKTIYSLIKIRQECKRVGYINAKRGIDKKG